MEVVNLDSENKDIFGDSINSEAIDPDSLFDELDNELSPEVSGNNPSLTNETENTNENETENTNENGNENFDASSNIYNPSGLLKESNDTALDEETLNENIDESGIPEIDTEGSEFEISLNNINLLDEKIRVFETEALEEDKIIANEKEQRDDLLNELMKKYPEKMRNSDFLKNKILKQIQLNVDLKNSNSVFNKENDIVTHKENGDNYRPLLDLYKNYNFKNKFIIPIVSEMKEIYTNSEVDYNNTIKTDFYNEVKNYNKIKTKYQKGIGRKNYSYINENKEISELLNPYVNKEPSKKLDNDTFVVRDCFSDKCHMFVNDEVEGSHKLFENKLDSHILLGKTGRNTNIEEKYLDEEDRIHINGFLMLPSEILNHLDKSLFTLEELTNHFNDFRNLNNYTDDYDVYVENIELDLKEGDRVKLCFSEDGQNINIDGVIIGIDINTYSIKPIDDTIDNVLQIRDDDANVTISKDYSVKNISEKDKLCFDELKDKITIFLFPSQDVSSLEYNKILNYVLPSTQNIVDSLSSNLKDVNNITQLNRIISQYGINYDDMTKNNIKFIRKNMNKNSDKSESISSQEMKEFNEFLQKKPALSKKTCPRGFIFNEYTQSCENLFIDSKSLHEIEEFYGKYPFYNTFIDNSSNRLKWIMSQADSGELYFKRIMKNKLEYNQKHKEKTLQYIRKEIADISENITTIDRDIISLTSIPDKCSDYILSKIYHNIQDLENDDYKEIKFDDELIKNIGTNIVQLGHYAILKGNGINKLYKRIEVGGKQIWGLEKSSILDKIMETEKDFCNQQGKNINEVNTTDLLAMDSCLSVEDQGCENKVLAKKRIEKKQKEDLLEEKKNTLTNLENSENFIFNISHQIDKLEAFLLNYKRYISLKPKSTLQIDSIDVDPKYSGIYKKIDMYLENISHLHDYQKLPHLKYLISKMSREPEAEENPKNIYCKYGNKVITCKHQSYLIRYYEENDESIIQEMIEEFGVESDGIHWCNNCGLKLDIDVFETTEGFVKTGARDITHEVVDESKDDTEYGTTEVFETIKSVINQEESFLEKDTFGIVKILVKFIEILGIDINQENIESLYKKIEIEIKNNIQVQELWISETSQKLSGRKKITYEKLLQKYNQYVTINVIYFTVSYLFIHLQTSIPEIELTKSHPECHPNILGYPLNSDSDDLRGIEFFTCIIQNLIRSSKEFGILKSKSVKENILRTVDKLFEDHFIKSLYEKKREYNLTNKSKVVENKAIISNWYEFRPPLNPITTTLEKLNPDNFEYLVRNLYNREISLEEINELMLKYKENLFIYSFELIKLYNFYVDNSQIENIKFYPTPLDNTCCLTKANMLTFDSYFTELDADGQISTIKSELENLHIILDYINNFPINTQYHVESVYHRKYLESFRRDILPTQPSEEDIIKLHLNYVSEGNFTGYKRIFDKNDVCIITGENKKNILKKTYLLSDYNSLMKNIVDSRRIFINNNSYKPELAIERMKEVVTNNTILNKNQIFFNTDLDNLGWFNRLEELYRNEEIMRDSDAFNEQLEILWNSLQTIEIEIERNEITETIGNILNLNPSNKTELSNILINLGVNPKQELENLENVPEHEIDSHMPILDQNRCKNKILVIKTFFNKISVFYSRLQNINEFLDENFKTLVPSNWKTDPTQYSRLKSLYKSYYNSFKKFENIDSKVISYCLNIINNSNNVSDLFSINLDNKNDFDYNKCSLFLEYIFLNLIKNLLPSSEVESLNTNALEDDNVRDDEIDNELYISSKNTSLVFNKSVRFNKKQKADMANILYEFLKLISFEKGLFNKYTKKQIQKNIKKDAENSKEKNLEFIGDLDKESRQSLKLLLNIGMEVWKDISKKRAGTYMDSAYEEEPVDDLGSQELLNFEATQELGENYTDDQYREWLENRSANLREDNEVRMEIEDGYLEEGDDANMFNYEE